ncbi:hypothetical protein BGZ80_005352 [Entomortierella chlamydospora]|uniref:BZIP domain-containing protein n=1 Tax=Entomortierella chlamydospora TaxID=101097 RepID=A0A9P6MKD0_9FUNG|nr:hypothetical protein BGZ79_010924 [Entomortierella chlamydospora]KAG0006061.1 hypothetical protein BGZ80_005352 [Entomortierella chlamydospora]
MTTVRSLPGDLASGNEVSGKSAINLPPSPTNSVPYIIATSADEDKPEKTVAAPVNGGSPMRFIQGCSKLDMEPNPFEQSFAGTGTGSQKTGTNGNTEVNVETPKPVLPPIEAMSGRLAPGSDQFEWDAQSLRMGPLSPSMLEGPQNPIVFGDKTTQNPLPIGSFPPSVPNIFTSGAPLADNGLPFLGVPGPLPAPPVVIHTAEPYQPAVYNPPHTMSQQQHPPHHQGGPQDGQVSRPPQNYANSNSHPPMNDRQMPPQAPHHPDNMNGFNNLHLLSQQAQATHQATQREMWIKRESADANGNGPHNQHSNAHGQPMSSQPRPHPHPGPPTSGQQLPGMPGMAAAPQFPKNGVESSLNRGARRGRMLSDDLSDDSDRSKHSGNSGDGTTGNTKKKQNTGDEKMDEEEKRKNFLERNRQAALKCRQRKKQWLANLQQKVEYLTTDNEQLLSQTAALRDEIIHLKALLLAHKDCPVAQANGVYADTIGTMGHERPGYPMQQHQQGAPQQGRGGPGMPRGPMQQPGPPHHHGPMPGGPRMGQPMPSSGVSIPGPMAPSTGAGRPMSMMQDITPSASPSQGQANVRY